MANKLCPYCSEPLEQGHRTDRCRDLEQSKLYGVSNNKMYVPSEYVGTKFERIGLNNTMVLTASGANMVGGVKQNITGDKYIENLQEVISVLQDKVDGILASRKKEKKLAKKS